MPKITLTDLANLSNETTVVNSINGNNTTLENAIDNTLSRDGTSPNEMEADLDMSSNRILNLPTATNATEPVTKAQLDAASTTVQFSGTVVESFTATAAQTLFTLSSYTYTIGGNNLQVYVNGVKQLVGAAYSETSTSSFTFTEGLVVGDVVEAVINQRSVDASIIQASSVTYDTNQDRSVQNRLEDWVSVKDFGAVGDGTTNDSSAFSDAIATGKTVFVPDGNYLLGTAITVSNSTHIIGGEGSKLIPDIGLAGGKVFAFEASDVVVENLTFDATGKIFTPATGNTYILFGGDGATKYYNHRYINNKVLTCSYSDGLTGASNLLVTHAFYVDNVDDVVIEGNIIDTISGACVFLRDNNNVVIQNNRFEDNQWYTVNLEEGVKHWSISNNQFLQNLTTGVYWGGSINVVSQVGGAMCTHGEVLNNYFTGYYAYGGVIRLQSTKECVVGWNVMDSLQVGSWNSSNDLTAIRCVTRGTSSLNKSNGQPRNSRRTTECMGTLPTVLTAQTTGKISSSSTASLEVLKKSGLRTTMAKSVLLPGRLLVAQSASLERIPVGL
jgi:hypothetical protein